MISLSEMNTLIPPIPTALAAISLFISYCNYKRDKPRLKIESNSDYFMSNGLAVHKSSDKLNDNENFKPAIRVEVCNIGRRQIYINSLILIWPTGENCSPPNESGIFLLEEGQAKEVYFPESYINAFSERKKLDKNINLNELQALAIDTSDKRWYSHPKNFSQRIKFLRFRICRKWTNCSLKNI